jgi:hypothetical protein
MQTNSIELFDDGDEEWEKELEFADDDARDYARAIKQTCSPSEYRAIMERAALHVKLREDDAARGIIWPHDIGGLQ